MPTGESGEANILIVFFQIIPIAFEASSWFRMGMLLVSACFLVPAPFSASRSQGEQQGREAAEYLVHLRQPSGDFARQVEKTGGQVLGQSKSGLLWLVSIPRARSEALRHASDVKQVREAVSVLIELDASAGDLTGRIEALGGLVMEHYANVPALAAAVPYARMAAVRALPGVRRIKKQKSFLPTSHPKGSEGR